MSTKTKPKSVKRDKKIQPSPPCTRQKSRYHSDNDSDSVDSDNEELSTAMSRLSNKFDGETKNIAKLLKSFDFMSKEFEQLQKRFDGLIKSNKELKKDVQQLKENEAALTNRVAVLENYVVQTKQNNNANHMVVTNLPQFSKDTDLKKVICKIGEQVGCEMNEADFLDIYQTENKITKTYPIIVKMKRNELKAKCMRYRKDRKLIDIRQICSNLENNNKNINFHHLIEKEIANLMNKAKEKAKEAGFKFVWYGNNAILVRKDEKSPVI